MKENCHNSRTRNDIDMKLGQVNKIDKRNKNTSKKFDVDVMLENYDPIAVCLIYGQFGRMQKPDSGRIVYKNYIFINKNLLSYKNSKQNWNTSDTALTLLLWVKVLFLSKNLFFCKKNAEISKIKRVLVLKAIFSETKYVCVLTCQTWSFWHNSNEF